MRGEGAFRIACKILGEFSKGGCVFDSWSNVKNTKYQQMNRKKYIHSFVIRKYNLIKNHKVIINKSLMIKIISNIIKAYVKFEFK